MKPLNHKERNSLFWQFLFLFIATVMILVFALNFDFEVPHALSEQQKKQYDETKSFFRNQRDIIAKMDSIDASLNAIERSSNPSFEQQKAMTLVNDFGRMAQPAAGEDSSKTSYLQRIHRLYERTLEAKASAMTYKRNDQTLREQLAEKRNRVQALEAALSTPRY
ncbi:type VI secretion system TssO [Flaviaesturariibacter amylovorans]|uniref:Type VI secretion system transmembrane protein TssO n=1 Tax=Flaviaesturariibacter amylovorans TaxID=1084520 RepID=A0ABP8HRI0_9BACT